jgi:hypothetical protein
MVLPPGHGQVVAGPRRLTLREKRLIASVLAVVSVIVVALIVSLAAGGRASARGCIHATIPGAVGAQEIDQCGAQARATCRTANQSGSFTPASARVIAAECRKAGLPVGG